MRFKLVDDGTNCCRDDEIEISINKIKQTSRLLDIPPKIVFWYVLNHEICHAKYKIRMRGGGSQLQCPSGKRELAFWARLVAARELNVPQSRLGRRWNPTAVLIPFDRRVCNLNRAQATAIIYDYQSPSGHGRDFGSTIPGTAYTTRPELVFLTLILEGRST